MPLNELIQHHSFCHLYLVKFYHHTLLLWPFSPLFKPLSENFPSLFHQLLSKKWSLASFTLLSKLFYYARKQTPWPAQALETGHSSSSFLQRKEKVFYARKLGLQYMQPVLLSSASFDKRISPARTHSPAQISALPAGACISAAAARRKRRQCLQICRIGRHFDDFSGSKRLFKLNDDWRLFRGRVTTFEPLEFIKREREKREREKERERERSS